MLFSLGQYTLDFKLQTHLAYILGQCRVFKDIIVIFLTPEQHSIKLPLLNYLISEASSFVTGALSVVDGGFDVFSI